jgi:ferredoxin
MLRKIRIILAAICFTLITLLFLDFTGTLHAYFGWLAKIQLFPAVMALNLGVVIALLLVTLIFGRIYCSVICPLGVFQDIISWVHRRKRKNRNKFRYSKALTWLRVAVLVLFVVALVAGIGSFAAILAPYSSYGRIVQNLFSPIYIWCNNLFAAIAAHFDSYAFYSVDVWIKSGITFAIALITLIVIAILAWRGGRTYCNTICPVGSVLGFISKFALLRPRFNLNKCNGCHLCSYNCKASCIDADKHEIDMTRCVACMDCIGNCHQGAITYGLRTKKNKPNSLEKEKSNFVEQNKQDSNESTKTDSPKSATNDNVKPSAGESNPDGKSAEESLNGSPNKAENAPQSGNSVDSSRRNFLSLTALFVATSTINAQKNKFDGGLAIIEDKKVAKRSTAVVPAGSLGIKHFAQHCTACQLCVSVCPNQVLRPSSGIMTLMQPEMSYERGFCRPECNKCSEVCPSGAISPIKLSEKSSIKIGTAKWIKANCIVNTKHVECGNCARHCPNGAIMMEPLDAKNPDSPKFPVVDEERCIGCGACEYECPARPFSAIYVDGMERHKTI